jgi:hypothetical protein
MELEQFTIEIVADKKKADELYSMMVNNESEYMELPSISLTAIKDFLDEKRDNVWEVTINDAVFLTVKADKDAAMALLKMVKGAGQEEFPLAALPAKNLRAFVQGQRKNVASLHISRNPNVQVRVKPVEKVEEKTTDKAKEKKEKDKE